jgi:hypothetical protein
MFHVKHLLEQALGGVKHWISGRDSSRKRIDFAYKSDGSGSVLNAIIGESGMFRALSPKLTGSGFDQ